MINDFLLAIFIVGILTFLGLVLIFIVPDLLYDYLQKRKLKKINKTPDKKSNTAKADTGKLKISLVPTEIIKEIAKVREYGVEKYHDPDNWQKVEEERFIDAMLRHILAEMEDPAGVDKESGLPHLSHVACNVAFILEMRKGGAK